LKPKVSTKDTPQLIPNGRGLWASLVAGEGADNHAIDSDQCGGIGYVVTSEWLLEGKMVMANRKLMRDYSGRIAPANYDRTTIVLHWLTVALTIALFALAESWSFLQHGSPLRKEFQSLHISLGILLAVVLAVRLGWRATRGRRLPAAVTGLQELAAKAMHYALYLLLTVQVVLGFLYRWAQGEAFMFFGLFPIQFAASKSSALDDAFGSYHNTVAWLIIILAGLHAAAALIHYYILKDGVLESMLPR
jgi:cytochrome b561